MTTNSLITSDNVPVSKVFIALGDVYRQEILLHLKDNGEVAYSSILNLFSLSRSAINHHMSVLEAGDVVTRTKKGKEIYFKLNTASIKSALDAVYGVLNVEGSN